MQGNRIKQQKEIKKKRSKQFATNTPKQPAVCTPETARVTELFFLFLYFYLDSSNPHLFVSFASFVQFYLFYLICLFAATSQ